MTDSLGNEPFDLGSNPSGGKARVLISLLFAIAFGSAGYALLTGTILQLGELSLPLGIFCSGGALMMIIFSFARTSDDYSWRVDPVERTIQPFKRGLFGRRFGKEIAFDQISHVQVDREVRTKGKQNYFPVYVFLKNDEGRRVFDASGYPAARVTGERLAKVLAVEFHDTTQEGPTLVRKPGELDETVRDRLRKTIYHRDRPPVPERMRAKIHQDYERLSFDIPRVSELILGKYRIFLWVAFAVLAGLSALMFYLEDYTFIFFTVVLLILLAKGMLRSETLVLTKEDLSVSNGIFFLRFTRKIPFSELEELRLLGAKKSKAKEVDRMLEDGHIGKEGFEFLKTLEGLGSTILARSDTKTIRFGKALPADELDHILYTMERWIR